MLRPSLQNDIHSALISNSYFVFTDFEINCSEGKNNNALLRITYRFDTSYFIFLTIPSQKSIINKSLINYITTVQDDKADYLIEGQICPGEMAPTETVKYFGKDGLITGIKQWTVRIKEDLQAQPTNRHLEEQNKQLEELLQKFKEFPDEYFTLDEAEKLKGRLDELEKRFAENFKTNKVKETELDKEMDEIKRDISCLKENISSFNKQNWFGLLASRSLKWIKEPSNQKMLKNGSEILKLFLPSNGIKVN
ncbi:MAG: hypothetical protein Q8940_07385 [Bacteroidota bacterium]|nr:hypothetical protein [Bacteroidota bacterium]